MKRNNKIEADMIVLFDYFHTARNLVLAAFLITGLFFNTRYDKLGL